MTYEPSQEYLQSRFFYKDGVLYWKHDKLGTLQWNGKHVGNAADATRDDGRCVIRLDGKLYLASRLIWIYHKGKAPKEIDHWDRDSTNDKIENLKPSNRVKNNANTTAKGWIKRGDKFMAKIYTRGRNIHLGTYNTAEEAHAVYAKKQEEIVRLHYGE